MWARSCEPRSTDVSVGQVTAESGLLSIPTSATSPGHVEPRAVQRGERADREQVVGAQDRVRAGLGKQPLGCEAAGLDHEVVGRLEQRLVALEPGTAQAVDIAQQAL